MQMSLKDEMGDSENRSEVLGLQRQIDKAQRESRDAMERARIAEESFDRVSQELDLMLGLTTRISEPPTWLVAPKKASKHRGTPFLLLSDLHLDEVVQPAEVLGMNAYNRKIAEMRLTKTFQGAAKITRDYWTGITYDGIVVPLMGDLYSGDIHEELTQTNEDTLLGSILHWTDHLAAGISLLADEFGKVHVPVVVGNHSRRTRKPRSKFRARDNFDWFTGQLLAKMFKNDKRVTFDVSESPDTVVNVYGHKVMVTHGDQANGGNGIGGAFMPIMRLDAKKRARSAAVQQPFDLMLLGHWHTLMFAPNFVVNGTTKGYDEYAFTSNFGYEEPSQALFVMTPEHGKTYTAPVFCADRVKEGW
jgi:hypothetical protein